MLAFSHQWSAVFTVGITECKEIYATTEKTDKKSNLATYSYSHDNNNNDSNDNNDNNNNNDDDIIIITIIIKIIIIIIIIIMI